MPQVVVFTLRSLRLCGSTDFSRLTYAPLLFQAEVVYPFSVFKSPSFTFPKEEVKLAAAMGGSRVFSCG
jgi:hypothetical protein